MMDLALYKVVCDGEEYYAVGCSLADITILLHEWSESLTKAELIYEGDKLVVTPEAIKRIEGE